MGASSPRRLVYALLIVVAAATVAGRIVGTERVYDPSVFRASFLVKGRVWPDKRPRPVPMFGSNDVSRWATVRALVDDRTYAIGWRDRRSVITSAASLVAARNGVEAAALGHAGNLVRTKKSDHGIVTESGWETVDKVLHPARLEFYSSKPPFLSTLVAGLYALLQMATGWTLRNNPFIVVRTILIVVNCLGFVLYLALLARLVERYGKTDWGRYFVLAAAAFATFVTPFTNTLNNHTVATFAVVLALYPALLIVERTTAALARGERLNGAPWYLFVVAGFFAAFTVCVELPAAAFAAALGGILLWLAPKRTLAFFLPAAIIPVVFFFVTNYLAVGQWRPAYGEFGGPWYEYEGSPHWRPLAPGEVRHGIDWAWTKESKGDYAFHLLLGHHGFFSLTPLWLLGLWAMLRLSPAHVRFWLGRGHTTPGEADSGADPLETVRPRIQALVTALTLIVSAVVIGFYIWKSNNYGGWTSGLRWFIWLSPLWLLTLLPVADCLGRNRLGRGLGYLLLAMSILAVTFPTTNPWRHPWLYRLMEALGWPGY